MKIKSASGEAESSSLYLTPARTLHRYSIFILVDRVL